MNQATTGSGVASEKPVVAASPSSVSKAVSVSKAAPVSGREMEEESSESESEFAGEDTAPVSMSVVVVSMSKIIL